MTRLRMAVLAGLALCTAAFAGPAETSTRVDRSVAAAKAFLLSRIDEKGLAAGEAPPNDVRFGGKTALCAQALLTAGVKPDESPALKRALRWLAGAKLTGTYAVAMRTVAWSLLRDPAAMAPLRQDTKWLVAAMNDKGGYTYSSANGQATEAQDNSNAQLALLGVWAGARRGVEVPLAFWRRAERHWLDSQQFDGGWGYRVDPRTLRCRTYGSMTAAGLASLYICFDSLRHEQFVRCAAAGNTEAIDKALAWLGEQFVADENPRKGPEWYYYWLHCVSRVGRASGHKYFARHDWHAEGRRALLSRQDPDGAWGYGDRVVETSFALIFLARGRGPVLVNKLRYGGKWNARPRDAANLSRWISREFERPVGWQIVHLDSPLADWHEAPILYLSGAGPVEMTADALGRLRTFVLRGGTILSEAACNNGDFSLDMGKVYRRLFPEYPLIRLPAEHPVYTAYFQPETDAGLSGVTNGVRLLALHAPRELSLALQRGARQTSLPTYQLLANVFLYATDRGELPPRGTTHWPEAGDGEVRATVRVARLKHNGNCDPEPRAWRRLAIRTANRHRVTLDVTEPMHMTKLDATQWPLAHMTGTDPFELSAAEAKALKDYFNAGGILLVDAAGGSRIFNETVERLIYPLAGQARARELAQGHPIYTRGPYDLTKASYRREYALTLAEADRTRPRLRTILRGGRPVLLHSREDVTTGLLGIPVYKLKGYSRVTAEQLMTNLVFYAGKVPRE